MLKGFMDLNSDKMQNVESNCLSILEPLNVVAVFFEFMEVS